MKPLFVLSSIVGMCRTRLSIASHWPPLLSSPRHDTMVIELSLHPIPSHPMQSQLALFHRGRRLARSNTGGRPPIQSRSVIGTYRKPASSVPGSPPHPAVPHCMTQRIAPSRLTCRGCSHVFFTFIPDLVACPFVCHCRHTEHYECK